MLMRSGYAQLEGARWTVDPDALDTSKKALTYLSLTPMEQRDPLVEALHDGLFGSADM